MTIEELFENIKVSMQETGHKHLKFEFRITKEDEITPIDMFEFSTRTSNALKGAHIFTVKELADRTTNSASLKGIHNLGAKSVKEIMNGLLYEHIVRNVENGRKPYDGITFC